MKGLWQLAWHPGSSQGRWLSPQEPGPVPADPTLHTHTILLLIATLISREGSLFLAQIPHTMTQVSSSSAFDF